MSFNNNSDQQRTASKISQEIFLPGMTLHCSKVIACINAKSVDLLSRFRVKGTSENIQSALLEALDKLDLEIQNICGITTDGDPVMVKLGRLLRNSVAPKPFYHQQCLAHALDLAVRSTFKQKEVPDDETEGVPVSDANSWMLAGIVDDDELRELHFPSEYETCNIFPFLFSALKTKRSQSL